MLSRKPLVVMIAAALCSAGITAASTSNLSVSPSLKAVDLAKAASAQSSHARDNSVKTITSGRKLLGTNQHIGKANASLRYQPQKNEKGEGQYLVRLVDHPVATYSGGIAGYEPTSLQARATLNKSKAPASQSQVTKLSKVKGEHKNAVQKYRDRLKAKQADLVRAAQNVIGNVKVSHRFTDASNTLVIKTTPDNAARIARLPGVARVERSKLYQLNTDVGPQHIGADQVWSGAATSGLAHKGEGMIVGVIDTGINSDHPSFAAVGSDGYQHVNPRGFGNYVGDCASNFVTMCNDKLIGVRSYKVITDSYKAVEFQAPDWNPWEPPQFKRPANGEDYHSHGSHTASTAAGNVIHDVDFLMPEGGKEIGNGISTGFQIGNVSGVAPHANIIAYQVCFAGGAGDTYSGCPSEALLAGIEDAINDGVDVINFSIGGSESFPWDDAIELAFLSAREAGISVSASAGNSGYYYSDHSAPWLLSVAATTHGRTLSISGKNLTELSGGDTNAPSINTAKGISDGISGSIVLASSFGDEKCLNEFSAGTFTSSHIVVCKRGENARVAKAQHVLAGGAGGFVLYDDVNDYTQQPINDVYPLPGVHIDGWSGQQLVDWLANGTGHMGTITASEIDKTIDPVAADIVADFSSRGPARTWEGALHPGIGAPGVDIYAAGADEQPFTVAPAPSDWMFMSGTSMASPHVAGAMALVRQAHSDWTPSEVQSAIQMTATPAINKPFAWSDPAPASYHDAGTGIINVANAVRAGLVLNESAENFRFANPQNGGLTSLLNLPYLSDFRCKNTCTFIRTFRATQSGTWSTSAVSGEHSVKLETYPKMFTVSAGEMQTIMVKVSILDSQTNMGNSEQEVHASVHLTPSDRSIPSLKLPVMVKLDAGDLPEAMHVTMNRHHGSFTYSDLPLPKAPQLSARSYAPVKAIREQISLPQELEYASAWQTEVLSDATATRWIDVPAGSLRLMAEVLKRSQTTAKADALWEAGDADIMIGYDANNDGEVQLREEAICISLSEVVTDWCNINHPEPGRYWVVIHNFHHYYAERVTDTYDLAMAVVAANQSAEFTAHTPSSSTGVDNVDLKLEWSLHSSQKGDVYYAAFDLGSDVGNLGSLGMVPVKLTRAENDLTLKARKTRARVGDVIDVTLSLQPNLTGADRQIALNTVIPSGLTLVPGSVKASSTIKNGVVVNGQNVGLQALQKNSHNWVRDYRVTTNLSDAQCRTPNFGNYPDGTNSNGGFVDLAKFGMQPSAGGNWQNQITIPFNSMFANHDRYALYNNWNDSPYAHVGLNPMGFVQYDDMPYFYAFHNRFPWNWFPDSLVGVLWRGNPFQNQILGTPLNIDWWSPQNNRGMTLAYSPDEYVVQWTGAATREVTGYDDDWNPIEQDLDDRYTFELITNMNYRYDEGEYEMIMAYDQVNFGSLSDMGSIGLQSFYGPRGAFGPVYDWSGVSYAFDDLASKIKKGMVVCYDYVGPESTQAKLSFKVRVDESAVGTTMLLSATHDVADLEVQEAAQSIVVNGNLQIGVMANKTIKEDSRLEDIVVMYSDADRGRNVITVTGDHITAVVHGDSSGSMIDVIPDANFFGNTIVTVIVADALNPSDRSSTSFLLTVTPEPDAPVAKVKNGTQAITAGATIRLDASDSYDPDGDALTFQWKQVAGTNVNVSNATSAIANVSNLAQGNYRFEVEVSDGDESSVAEVSVNVSASTVAITSTSKSGGGSMPLLLGMLALCGIAIRQRKRRR